MSRRSRRRGRNNNSGVLITFVIIAACAVFGLIISNSHQGSTPPRPAEDYDGVCFVSGNVANSPAPDFTDVAQDSNIIDTVIENTPAGRKPLVCMYSVTPSLYAIKLDDLELKGENSDYVEIQKENLITEVNEKATQSPSENGADYFGAIIKANRYLTSNGAKHPLVIVYGSGLSDYGIMNYAFGGLLSQEDQTIVDTLSKNNYQKDEFDGSTIKWYGAGQVVQQNGQNTLDDTWKTKITGQYTKAFGYLGIYPSFIDINTDANAQSVTTKYIVNPTFIPKNLKSGFKLSLNEQIAGFQPDSARLEDYENVKAMLRAFAKEFNDATNLRLKITGYHAKCGGGSNRELSLKRAETIRGILVNEYQVDKSRIDIDGVGGPQDDREEEPECGHTGVAADHRTVILETMEK